MLISGSRHSPQPMVAAGVEAIHLPAPQLSKFGALGNGVPRGIRTPVASVKGMCPRPLDDGDAGLKWRRATIPYVVYFVKELLRLTHDVLDHRSLTISHGIAGSVPATSESGTYRRRHISGIAYTGCRLPDGRRRG